MSEKPKTERSYVRNLMNASVIGLAALVGTPSHSGAEMRDGTSIIQAEPNLESLPGSPWLDGLKILGQNIAEGNTEIATECIEAVATVDRHGNCTWGEYNRGNTDSVERNKSRTFRLQWGVLNHEIARACIVHTHPGEEGHFSPPSLADIQKERYEQSQRWHHSADIHFAARDRRGIWYYRAFDDDVFTRYQQELYTFFPKAIAAASAVDLAAAENYYKTHTDTIVEAMRNIATGIILLPMADASSVSEGNRSHVLIAAIGGDEDALGLLFPPSAREADSARSYKDAVKSVNPRTEELKTNARIFMGLAQGVEPTPEMWQKLQQAYRGVGGEIRFVAEKDIPQEPPCVGVDWPIENNKK